MKLLSDILPSLLLLLVLLFCVHYENQLVKDQKAHYQHRSLLAAPGNSPEEEPFKEVSAPPMLLGGIHRGAKYNLSGIRNKLSSNRNSSRFNLTPLPPPPPPSESSCQLTISSENNHKILLFVDNPFFNHFLNWLAHFEDICGKKHFDRLDVICMDHAVIDKVEQGTSLQCSPQSFLLTNETFHLKHKIVWRHRMTIIVRYLEQNISLLLSDLDALWRGDPYPDIRRYLSTGHNVIASRGLWPQKLSDQWGAAICMGFIFLQPTPFSINLMRTVLTLMEKTTPDDQQAINTVLYQWNITWSTTARQRLPLLRNPLPDVGIVPYATGHDERVLLLPHDFYIRNCTRHRTRAIVPTLSSLVRQRLRNVTIAHCVAAPGNSYKKYMHLQVIGMWHRGVPAPLRNESMVFLPKDTGTFRAKKFLMYNSSTAIAAVWKTAMAKGSLGSSESLPLVVADLTTDPTERRSSSAADALFAQSQKLQQQSRQRETASQALIRMHRQQKEEQSERMGIEGAIAPKSSAPILINTMIKNNHDARVRRKFNKEKSYQHRFAVMQSEKRLKEAEQRP